MSDTDTLLLAKPKGQLRTALDNEVVELLRKYGVTVVILWQLLGGGIKTSFEVAVRTVLREELAPLQAEIKKLDARVALLETKRP